MHGSGVMAAHDGEMHNLSFHSDSADQTWTQFREQWHPSCEKGFFLLAGQDFEGDLADFIAVTRDRHQNVEVYFGCNIDRAVWAKQLKIEVSSLDQYFHDRLWAFDEFFTTYYHRLVFGDWMGRFAIAQNFTGRWTAESLPVTPEEFLAAFSGNSTLLHYQRDVAGLNGVHRKNAFWHRLRAALA